MQIVVFCPAFWCETEIAGVLAKLFVYFVLTLLCEVITKFMCSQREDELLD